MSLSSIHADLLALAASLAAWCELHITAETADQIETFFNGESAQ